MLIFTDLFHCPGRNRGRCCHRRSKSPGRIGAGIPTPDLRFSTSSRRSLYELIFDLLLVAALWLGYHRRIKPPGLFALYVAGYSSYRIFEEMIRIDSSQYILGMRLDFWIAFIVTPAGLAWFAWTQRHRMRARDMAKGVALLAAGGLDAPPPAVASPPRGRVGPACRHLDPGTQYGGRGGRPAAGGCWLFRAAGKSEVESYLPGHYQLS